METGDFSEERRSPQFLAFDVLQVRLGLKTLCGLLNSLIFIKIDVKSGHLAGLSQKIAHFQILPG
jgi:hypothetical protein